MDRFHSHRTLGAQNTTQLFPLSFHPVLIYSLRAIIEPLPGKWALLNSFSSISLISYFNIQMRPLSLKVNHHNMNAVCIDFWGKTTCLTCTSVVICQFYVGSASCFPILLGITFALWSNFCTLPLMIAASVCVSTSRVGLLMNTQHERVITECWTNDRQWEAVLATEEIHFLVTRS